MRSLELGHGHVAQSAWMEKSRQRRRLKWKILKRRKKTKKLSEKWFEFYTSKVCDVWQPATILFIAHTHTRTHSLRFDKVPFTWEGMCGPISHTYGIRWLDVRCHHHRRRSRRPPYPLKRKCQKLFWCILFEAVDFTLFLIFLLLFWQRLFCLSIHLSIYLYVHAFESVRCEIQASKFYGVDCSSSWTISCSKWESFYFSSVILGEKTR